MKRVIGIVLVLCLTVAALVGCSSTPTQSATSTDTAAVTQDAAQTAASNVKYYQAAASTGTTPPAFKIGVSFWSWADNWGVETKKALDYIAPLFGCTMQYENWAPPMDSEGILSTHNALIQSGCDGIIATYVSPGLMQSSEEANVPYVQYTADIGKDQGSIDMANANGTYVGSVAAKMGKTGWELAEGLYESGARNWLLGATPAGQYQSHDDVAQGIKAFIDAHSDVNLVMEVRDGTTFVDTMRQAWLANPQIDGIVTSVNDGAMLAALEQDGMVGKIKCSVHLSPEGTEHYMDVGLVVLCTPNENSAVEIAFAMLYNALSGHNLLTDKITPLFEQLIPTTDLSADTSGSYLYARNLQEFQLYQQYIYNSTIPVWSEDEIKSLCPAFNPDATLDSIKDLLDGYSIVKIAEKRGYTPSATS